MNAPPRLLLVEDDPVSAHFLHEVLQALPAHVVHAPSCKAALAALRGDAFALWLVDANLPDGDAEALLERMADATPAAPAALALTADPFPERRTRLLSAGFVDVLEKPLEAARLQVAVRRHLAAAATAPPCATAVEAGDLWDERGALHAAGGNPESVRALRALFAQELPLDRDRVLAALHSGADTELQDTLHRLKAACGFVGARHLLETVRALARAPGDPATRKAFEAACRSTLAGL